MIVAILQEADTKILNAPFTPSGGGGEDFSKHALIREETAALSHFREAREREA